MKNLLIKEVRLAASPLAFFFLAAAFMTMLPGYPILMGAFFICMGIFHSFQRRSPFLQHTFPDIQPPGGPGSQGDARRRREYRRDPHGHSPSLRKTCT